MKKRILSMILMVTMIMGIFTGCGVGASSSMEKITVSEMLASVMEENNGEAVIFTHHYSKDNAYKKNFSEKTKWEAWVYDGEMLNAAVINCTGELTNNGGLVGTSEYTLKEFYSASTFEKSEGRYSSGKPSWEIDITREDTPVEYMKFSSSSHKYPTVYFGKCEHVEIEGESYMFFKAYQYDYKTGLESTEFTLIKDTEFTKDKLVVVDSVEEVKTREWNLESSFYDHAWFSELTDEDKATSGIED